HHAHAARDLEGGTKVGAGPAFYGAAEVEEAVGGQKDHRYDARDGVELCDEDATPGDDKRDDQRVARLQGWSVALGEPDRRDAVAADGLQDARGTHDAS